jgi:hypothetical protein
VALGHFGIFGRQCEDVPVRRRYVDLFWTNTPASAMTDIRQLSCQRLEQDWQSLLIYSWASFESFRRRRRSAPNEITQPSKEEAPNLLRYSSVRLRKPFRCPPNLSSLDGAQQAIKSMSSPSRLRETLNTGLSAPKPCMNFATTLRTRIGLLQSSQRLTSDAGFTAESTSCP